MKAHTSGSYKDMSSNNTRSRIIHTILHEVTR